MLAAGLLFGVTSGTADAAVVPTNFVDQLVASVPAPTALAFTPDGRLLVTSQTGQLRVIDANGTLNPTPALDLSASVCSDSERGLLGVAVDPSFTTNHYIYLYYTFKNGGSCLESTSLVPGLPVNTVARFTLGANDVVDPSSKLTLVTNMVDVGGNHNGGDLKFGPDGYLYVTVGDGGCDRFIAGDCGGQNEASRHRSALLGKVLRITTTGGVPPSNPFTGPNTAPCAASGWTGSDQISCQETFAWGLRNPFRIAFDPNSVSTKLFINDVGQNTWEEIDLGQSGADYGWNVREGFCAEGSATSCGPPPAGMTNPIYAYGHSNGCDVITAGAFVPLGYWPGTYDDSYLFTDEGCGTIWRLVPGAGGTGNAPAFGSVSSPVSFAFGPSGHGQALYYTSYSGQVRRIAFRPPAGFAGPGSLTCTSGAPRLSANMPLVFARSDPNGYQYVAARTDFYHWNGSTWGLASSAPWLLSVAYPDGPGYQWFDLHGSPQGTSATVRQTLPSAASGIWAAIQEVHWFSSSGALVGSNMLLAGPTRGPEGAATPGCVLP